MRVLSTFDGMAGARFALDRLGITPSAYFASEIEAWPMKIAKHNFPDIQHIGDVCNIKAKDYPDIDLLIGGSPCTSLSSAKGQKESGLEKGESTLFWEYLRILDEVKPKYFLLENVASMKTSDRNKISKVMGVEPIMICSSLVSAQMRKRLYWTNIKGVKQPTDQGIFLKDIIDDGWGLPDKSLCLTSSYGKACAFDYEEKSSRQLIKISGTRQGERTFSLEGKAPTLLGQTNGGEFYAVAKRKHRFDKNGKRNDKGGELKTCIEKNDSGKAFAINSFPSKSMVGKHGEYRKLTVAECERLQGVPIGATALAPKTHAIKALGNGFQIDTVSHILSYMGKHGTVVRRKKEQLVLF